MTAAPPLPHCLDGPAAFALEAPAWLGWLECAPPSRELLGEGVPSGSDAACSREDGVRRVEQALCAAVASRFNGCFFCASVHARTVSQACGRTGDMQRLLDQGTAADLGPRWNAIAAASAALSATPSQFGAGHVRELRRVGLDDDAIAAMINAVALCNGVNRLTLSLGEPAGSGTGRDGGRPAANRNAECQTSS
ncbi:peroxidase-related enzyme [Labrys monachus]|uniref:Peroxidase-related enzyme n=1 Tax=Labrys monachus TaxID=217067 RepID=A0ABU0FCF5_9HYPH|nr:peroxidase-related enzyme [Labrys monachus]MDQ0392289.1 putative peroxidase-related enzyme [Labrys monachus]